MSLKQTCQTLCECLASAKVDASAPVPAHKPDVRPPARLSHDAQSNWYFRVLELPVELLHSSAYSGQTGGRRRQSLQPKHERSHHRLHRASGILLIDPSILDVPPNEMRASGMRRHQTAFGLRDLFGLHVFLNIRQFVTS